MIDPMPFDKEVEEYSSFKKRKFNKYLEKARMLFVGVDDLSLKPQDKKKLKKQIVDLLSKVI